MAFFGDFFIGGSDEEYIYEKYNKSGAVFPLNKSCTISTEYFFDDIWVVDIIKDLNCIIARSNQRNGYEKTLTEAYRVCQEALDLLSVQHHQSLVITFSRNGHLTLYCDDNQIVLRSVSIFTSIHESSIEIEIRDKNGKIKPIEKPPSSQWINAYRYYRLSQLSSDPEEAYRNLFLSFESILSTFSRPNGTEKPWIKSTLKKITSNNQISFFKKDTNNNNAIEHFVDNQYNIRCQLFHAKDNCSIILPCKELNPITIIESYKQLLFLWQEIAIISLKSPIGGGCITNIGFIQSMKNLLQTNYSMEITEDDSPVKKEDTKISPKNMPCLLLANKKIDYNTEIGQVSLLGELKTDTQKMVTIQRSGLIVGKNPYAIDEIKNGLKLCGINRYEYEMVFRMENANAPVTRFERK